MIALLTTIKQNNHDIFHGDETGRLLTEALLRAADRAVRVRVLVDDGATVMGDEQVLALNAHRMIEVRVFNPFVYRGHANLLRAMEFLFNASRLDYRMHNYGLHAKLFVFDRRKIFMGSMNFDPRSKHLNTEVGVIIDSAELAAQTAARFDAMVRPENSYALALRQRGAGGRPHLVWRTEEGGQAVEYPREPARSVWQRLKVKLFSLLPLDREL